MRATQVMPLFLSTKPVIARFMRATQFVLMKENGSPAFAGDDDFF
jgi:hypothetical protein